MKTITAAQNPLIKQVKCLQSAKGRAALNVFTAEGLHTISTMLAANSNLILASLFCTDQTLALAQSLASDKQIVLVTTDIMQKISSNSTPAELLAVFEIPKVSPENKALTTGLVLAQVSDPGNMGTLIRTSAAMGYKTVVIIEGADVWSPKVVQASAGTIGLVNIFELSWEQLQAAKQDLNLCALVVKDGENPQELDLKNALLVVGSEAHGLPTAWVNDCQQKMTLPMPGGTESLNVAVAGSIALYLAIKN